MDKKYNRAAVFEVRKLDGKQMKKEGMERGEGSTIYVDLWRYWRRSTKDDEEKEKNEDDSNSKIKCKCVLLFLMMMMLLLVVL